ncbi:MAG: TRAP transporter substrate-binding protein DctP [Acidobacteria bacterium]|jgi:TRAP-type C4-dicarboxylate transport system substrate-binding protein|nr:TRAP transporter substrate-binding protein DctP [Acidobacteriota bacterium]
MFRFIRVLAVVAAAGLLSLPLAAQSKMELKLATFAPANTTWHRALTEMGAAVTKATAGRVVIRVFANGTQGPEATVVSLMRVGQLNAALLMPAGLAQIDPSINAFAMPFFIQDDAELQHLLDTVGPEVGRRLDAKGFHLLNWGSAGWVQVFSKQQIRTLDDLKRAKLFTSAGDDDMVRWYSSNGFHPQALSEREIVTQLRLPNGMIDAVPSPPYGALALQFYSATPYMLDLRVAPLVGATVVSKTAWNRLSADDRRIVSDAALAMQRRVLADVPKVDADAVAAMRKAKLTVTTLDAAARAEFQRAAAQILPSMRGSIVPADMYDMALKARDSYRQSRGR